MGIKPIYIHKMIRVLFHCTIKQIAILVSNFYYLLQLYIMAPSIKMAQLSHWLQLGEQLQGCKIARSQELQRDSDNHPGGSKDPKLEYRCLANTTSKVMHTGPRGQIIVGPSWLIFLHPILSHGGSEIKHQLLNPPQNQNIDVQPTPLQE